MGRRENWTILGAQQRHWLPGEPTQEGWQSKIFKELKTPVGEFLAAEIKKREREMKSLLGIKNAVFNEKLSKLYQPKFG